MTTARYFSLMGKRVEVRYRAGDIYLPAKAILVADSGKSIFLEEHIHQDGRMKAFRWEIPYVAVMGIDECAQAQPAQREQSSGSESAASSSASILGLEGNPSEA